MKAQGENVLFIFIYILLQQCCLKLNFWGAVILIQFNRGGDEMAILLTGLTGVVGSALASILQTKEKVFCLVRNGHARVRNGELHGIKEDCIIDGDLLKNFCSMEKKLTFLKQQKISKIVHLAGSVKFDDYLMGEIWTTNLLGTQNALNLAKELKVKEFHLASTAYAEAKRNPYERSKITAEELVKNFGIPYSIYRLAIVVGSSKTGHINAFNGYYGFFAGLHRLAKNRAEKGNGVGKVDLPIYIDCSFNSTLNLVPIDWLTEMMTELIDLKPNGETYYLTNPNPKRVQWIMEEGFCKLGINGIKYTDYRSPQPEQNDNGFKAIQKAVNKKLDRYRPYVTEEGVFSLEDTKRVLGAKYKPAPEITSKLLAKLLDFAIKKDFGDIKKNIAKTA